MGLLALVPLWVGLVSGSARGGDLAWRWDPARPSFFALETVISTPKGSWFLAADNLEARALESTLSVETTCAASAASDPGWRVTCVLDRVRLSGIAMPGEEDALRKVLQEYSASLTGKRVTFQFSEMGRVRSLKVEGLDASTSRKAFVVEQKRLLLSRSFGLLELELPKNGEDRGRSWKQGGTPIVMTLRSREGTAGGVSLQHRVLRREGARVFLETDGRATVSPGAATDSGGTLLLDVRLSGEAEFDVSKGQLIRREYLSKATKTVSSSETSEPPYYREIGSLELRDVPIRGTAPSVGDGGANDRPSQNRSLRILLEPETLVEALELTCPQAGTRDRRVLEGRRVEFPSLPDEPCILHFKGPTAARFEPVGAGGDLVCRLEANIAICEEAAKVLARARSAEGPGRSALEVRWAGSHEHAIAELVCPSNHRDKGEVLGGRTVFEGVPVEDCTLLLRREGVTSQFRPVRGGQRLLCPSPDDPTRCQEATAP
jgi:hypothetical protein